MRNVTTTILVMVSFIGILFFVETAQSYDSKVYHAQKKLKDLGYDPGLPDGIWGKKTKAAVKRFQQANGLSATGKLDEQTKAKLSVFKPVSQLSLNEAVKTNDIDKVKAQLAAGADVNGRDKLGETPLHVATVRGYKDASSLLIAKGADVDAKNEDGITPLDVASQKGYWAIVAILRTYKTQE